MFRNEYALSLQLNSIKIETSFYKQTSLCFPISLRSWFIPRASEGRGKHSEKHTHEINGKGDRVSNMAGLACDI